MKENKYHYWFPNIPSWTAITCFISGLLSHSDVLNSFHPSISFPWFHPLFCLLLNVITSFRRNPICDLETGPIYVAGRVPTRQREEEEENTVCLLCRTLDPGNNTLLVLLPFWRELTAEFLWNLIQWIFIYQYIITKQRSVNKDVWAEV